MSTSIDSGQRSVGGTMRVVGRIAAAVVVLASVSVVALAINPFGDATPPVVEAAGASAGLENACQAGEKVGVSGFDDQQRTDDGLSFRVRTPADYDATRAYPLLVIYPPASMGRASSERYYKITPEATRRGFIVAYSDHVPLSRTAVSMQARVAKTVMERWCVRGDAVAFLGHSDGGSIAEGSLISPQPGAVRASAIVASAAGIEGKDIEGLCRSAPIRLMVVHSQDDERFPGFGRDVAKKWAAYEGCAPELPVADASGCSSFRSCRTGSRIDYCETTGPHSRWHGITSIALAFIEDAGAKTNR